MDHAPRYEIFAVCPPGLEAQLCAEVRACGFEEVAEIAGGVQFRGGWPEIWRANLQLRGAVRILVRLGDFMAFHLAQLDKRARKFEWGAVLRPDVPVRVEVTCRKSKIYHAGAAAQRIETALTESHGITVASDAGLVIKIRIDDNRVVISLDTSGESLHKRGHKAAVGKAPMRETMAAMFLRQCGYVGAEPVLDPMCGSGTFVIEAAEMAAGLMPGRSRSFAFETLASFDAAAWAAMKARGDARPVSVRFHGLDRDQGAIRMAQENAARASVSDVCQFECRSVADLERPEGPPGLIMVNPPYGARIGNKKPLFGLYSSMGEIFRTRFAGWRVGLITSEPALAKATGLSFAPTGPSVPHGGLKVWLFQTKPL